MTAQQLGHLAEVVGHQFAVAGLICLARRWSKEVGDMTQMVAEFAVDVTTFTQCMHLVNSDPCSSSACSSRVSTSLTGSPFAFGMMMSAPGSTYPSTASGGTGFVRMVDDV